MGNRIARPVRPPPAPPAVRTPAARPPPAPPAQTAPSPSPPPAAPHPLQPITDEAVSFRPRLLNRGGRQTLDKTWIESSSSSGHKDAHSKLLLGGFIQQAHSGVYHLLPLGLRVQTKLCRLIDTHMQKVGADKVQLSAITTEDLWHRSGRLDKAGSELYRLVDRQGSKYVLNPTHEEVITNVVSQRIRSNTDIPLRIYQMTQKYRDELRPRQGLLRTREFLMKDLYTFDYDVESALETYEEVREAYRRIFIDELKLPILVAQASSGDMGGDLSHEYHIPTHLGEDQVMSCRKCDYVANEEVVEARPATDSTKSSSKNQKFSVWRGISKCRTVIVNVWIDASFKSKKGEAVLEAPKDSINLHAVKKVFPDLDSGVEQPAGFWSTDRKTAPSSFKVVNLFDASISEEGRNRILDTHDVVPEGLSPDNVSSIVAEDTDAHNFLRLGEGDSCPRCSTGSLKATKVIELGHTFHLGTRYSIPMKACVTRREGSTTPVSPAGKADGEESTNDTNTTITRSTSTGTSTVTEVKWKRSSKRIAIQMGCHGIGISRLMGAIANHVNSKDSLNWPRVIAPYEVVLSSDQSGAKTDMEDMYDRLTREGADVVIDSHTTGSLSQRFAAYSLIGIPIWVSLGKRWARQEEIDIRCPRLKFRTLVPKDQMSKVIKMLLEKL